MKNRTTKILAIALAVVTLALAVCIGTFAYLISNPAAVKNTFTVGENVVITLTENDQAEGAGLSEEYLPGKTITKKAKVSVDTNSRDCWVFVKVVYSTDLATYVDFKLNTTDWDTEISKNEDAQSGLTTVILAKSAKATATESFSILEDDKVVCKSTVSTMITEELTMEFTAYAIQESENYNTASEAWTVLNAQLNPSSVDEP